MPYTRTFIPGDRLVECDGCGFGYRRSQMRKGVSGTQKRLNMCPKCWDPPHPNDERVPHRREGALTEIN